LAGTKGVELMMEGNPLIMTQKVSAKYLKIGKSTSYKMAEEGNIDQMRDANSIANLIAETRADYIHRRFRYMAEHLLQAFTSISETK
jgi:hypothetical protein